MSEKLYKSHCVVQGHGTKCEAALDKVPSKRKLSKMRRLENKRVIAKEISVIMGRE